MRSSATSSGRPSDSESSAAPVTITRRRPRRPQLSDEVAADLRHAIMTAEFRPGEYIRMDEAAARLGVSVTPVREALLTLRGEGMVHLVPHRGYAVAELSRTDVGDLFWLQSQIAVKLALRIADVVTAGELDELTDLNDQLRQAISRGAHDRVIEAEYEFHRRHNLIANSGKLSWFLMGATRYTPTQLYASDAEWGQVAIDSHDRLIVAYRAGDREQIVAQTQRQFDDGATRLLAHLETTGIWAQ
ncbi:GntR family transcriptional regulator [Gordonia sp. CPCC 205333]|uniref:GntR family transcriptional regulator n=1 Tax=Gordonia sp. CPCC 205333 TaxID=3140790 RepID=UPI003AF369D9